MPHDIDVGTASKKDCSNPYATEGSITIRPSSHRRKDDKIRQTIIDIVLLIDKNKLTSYEQLLSEPNILIRIISLCTMRGNNFTTPDGEKVSASKFLKLAKKYVKDTIDADLRFWMEDVLRDTAEEMLEEYRKADAELREKKQHSTTAGTSPADCSLSD